MKNKFLIAALLIVSSSSYAEGFKQHVQVCGNVANELPYQFKVGFQSADSVKLWKTVTLNNGTACVDHIYREGPKNLRLKIDALGSGAADNVKLNLDESCKLMHSRSNINYISEYLNTTKQNIIWKFNIAQMPSSEANPNIQEYKVTCDYNEN